MFQSQRRHGGTTLLLVLGCCLLAVFIGLAIYEFQNGEKFEANEVLLAELEKNKILDDRSAPPQPGDWPQWRGVHRDGVSEEAAILLDWPDDGPKVLWRADCGEGYSSVAVAKGQAFTLGSNSDLHQEIVFCWDAATGKEIWRHEYEAGFIDRQQGSGPRSTPTIDGDRVYTVGATGILHCLDVATGKSLWPKPIDLLKEFYAKNTQWGVSFSPLVEGDLLLTNPGASQGNSIVAFNKMTGEVMWRTLDDPAGYSSPVAATAAGMRQVLFFTGAGLVSLSPADGKLLWRFPWDTSFQVNSATPLVFRAGEGKETSDYVFISSGYSKGCALLKIVAGADGNPGVEKVYSSNLMRNHFNSSVRQDDYLYGFDDAQLRCLNLLTGKKVWSKGGFQKGSLILVAGHLIVLGENGQLALVEATPKEFREVASSKIFYEPGKRTFTPPSFAHGRLYLRDQKEVVCLDLQK
jgi:outer membrane protein assembly factor BamB